MPIIDWITGDGDFPARWHCGNWSDVHGWTHIVSNSLTAIAYFLLSVWMWVGYVKGLRGDGTALGRMFCGFIAACGLGHVLEVVVFWVPIYRPMAVMSAITAAISVYTTFWVFRRGPK